jgi:hypothetical protein
MKISSFILILFTLPSPFGFCQDTSTSVVSHENVAVRNSPVAAGLADYDYAWDQVAHRGRLIWDCRGLQCGRFVAPELCVNKEMVDTHWPDKKIPGFWKP